MSTGQDTKVKETEPRPHTTIAHVVQSITRGKQSLPEKPPVPLLGMASFGFTWGHSTSGLFHSSLYR